MKKSIIVMQIFAVAAVCLTAFRVSSSSGIPRIEEREDLDKAMNIPRKAPASFSYRTDAPTLSTYPNIDCNTPGNSVIQGETSVAINPVNPNIIVAGANDYRSDSVPPEQMVYLSTDGGMTWSNNYLPACPDTFAYISDPSLTYDANGTAFFGFGALTSALSSSVMVQRSTDGGLHWQSPASVYASSFSTGLEDKYYVGADASPNSPYKNNVYISWTHFTYSTGYSPTLLYFSRSTDEGVTWQAPTTIDSNAYYSQPAVGPNGDVYIAYMNAFFGAPVNNLMIARSTDGGATFSASKQVGPPIWPLPSSLVNKDTIRMISYPSVAVDRSTLHPGRLYIAWAALNSDNGTPHIYLTYSDNGGQDWISPLVIDGDVQTGTDKFHPWLACDPITGTVAISYYDSRNDPQNNVLVDVYLSYSNDGAQSFNTVRVTNTSFGISIHIGNSTSGGYWADYTGIASYNGKIVPCWTDQRSGNSFYNTDVYVSIIESSSGVAGGTAIAPSNIAMGNYPNPFSSATNITLSGIPSNGVDPRASLKIYDAAGKQIADLTPDLTGSSHLSIPFNAQYLSSGAYYAALHTKYGDIRKQLTVVK